MDDLRPVIGLMSLCLLTLPGLVQADIPVPVVEAQGAWEHVYEPPEVDVSSPSAIVTLQGEWMAFTSHFRVIAFNTRTLDWFDIDNPTFNGRIAVHQGVAYYVNERLCGPGWRDEYDDELHVFKEGGWQAYKPSGYFGTHHFCCDPNGDFWFTSGLALKVMTKDGSFSPVVDYLGMENDLPGRRCLALVAPDEMWNVCNALWLDSGGPLGSPRKERDAGIEVYDVSGDQVMKRFMSIENEPGLGGFDATNDSEHVRILQDSSGNVWVFGNESNDPYDVLEARFAVLYDGVWYGLDLIWPDANSGGDHTVSWDSGTHSMAEDPDGSIWVSFTGHLIKLDTRTLTCYSFEMPPSGSWGTPSGSMQIAPDGTVWITQKGGLWAFYEATTP